MKLKTHILVLAAALILSSCSSIVLVDTRILECAHIPEARIAASAVAIGNKAYVFAGRDASGTSTSDLWEYDTETDVWNKLPDTGLPPRVNGIMVTDGEYLYMGLGFGGKRYNEDSVYLRDFWRYSSTSNSFERLADYPTEATDRPVALYNEGKIYVFFGWKDEFNRDICIYDIATDTWEHISPDLKKNDYPPRVFAATGSVCKDRLFVGTGFMHGSRDFWAEYDLMDGSFKKCTSVPMGGRHNAACASDGEYVYVAGGWHYGDPNGSGYYHSDIVRYDPDSDQWEYCGAMPYSAQNMIGFAANGTVYFGLGEDSNGAMKSLYRIEKQE